MAIIALVALVVVIVIGTVKKINIGIVGIAGACVLALVSNMSVRDLVAGFNATLFLRLLGIQLLVCAAQANGTMETLAKRVVFVGSRRSIRLIPILIYIAFLACGFAGIDIIFLATPFIMALAFQLGMSPIKVLIFQILAFQGSGMSPLGVTGINATSLAEKAGIVMNGWNGAIVCSMATTIMCVAAYFIFGWQKEQSRCIDGLDNTHFDLNQILTLLGFVAYVVCTMFLEWDTLIAPTLIAFVLMMIGVAEPKKVVSNIPWNVLIMIGGMSMMTGAVSTLGGVELLSNAIASVSAPALCVPLILLVAGLMSFFSSGNGVVLPTLIQMVPNLKGSVTGMVAGICMGAGCTGISPFSTIGGHMMSCYDSIYKPTDEERTKMFNELLITSIVCLATNALFSLLGLYNLTFF